MEENKKNRLSFFRRIKWAIFNMENYDFFAVESPSKAFAYFIKLIFLFSLLISIAITYVFYNNYKSAIHYVEENIPEFVYQQGNLTVEQEDIIVQENEQGTIMIDTNIVENTEKAKEYIEKLQTYQMGMLFLKDKVIIKLPLYEQVSTYSYQEITENWQTQDFTKTEAIEYVKNIPAISVIGAFYIASLLYLFMIYTIAIGMDVILLSILGVLTSRLAKIKLRYLPIVNISIYALTLPILLNAIYIIVNILTGFEIQYFQIMYNAISYIYLVTVILMIKSEMIKQELEIMKLAEEQKRVREELERQKEEEKQKEDQKKREQEKEQEKEKKDNEKPTETGEAQEGLS